MVRNERWAKFGVLLVALFFIVCLFTPVNPDVNAVNTVGVRITVWDSGSGQATGALSGFPDGVSGSFVIYLSKPVNITSCWGCTIASGNGTSTIRFNITPYGNSLNHDWGCNFTALEGQSIDGLRCNSASGTTGDPLPSATTTTTTTTTVPAATTPAATTSSTTAATTTSATTAATTTEGNGNQPSETTTVATTTGEETTSSSEETLETSEQTDVIPADGETTAVTAEAGEPTDTPTPTTRHITASGLIKRGGDDDKKGGFPWWIILVLLIAGAGGYRYYQLVTIEKLAGIDILCEFIPGGIIGTIVDKINPSLRATTTSAPAEPEPEVVNGYLKTSNTKSIRPMYSNIPGARKEAMDAAGKAAVAGTAAAAASTSSKSSTVTPKPPIKRPSSASVNHAQAASANSGSVAEPKVAPVPKNPENKVPLQQRPPIKRPKSLSSNRAVANAAAGTAAVAAASTDKDKSENEVKPDPTPKAPAPETKAQRPSPFRPETRIQQKVPSKRPRAASTMNRPDSSALNSEAAPTAAALAFEKQQSEAKATPAIATAFVPPVIEKKKEETINPFKPLTREDGSIIEAERNTSSMPGVAAGAIPKVVEKKAANPFKASQNPNGMKAPIKRPKSASVNHAQAAAAGEEEAKNAESGENIGVVKALGSNELHTTFKPTAFVEKEKIDPFKHNKPEQE